MFIIEESWVTHSEYWVNIIGLPHHLWSSLNAERIGELVREGLIEVDRDCLEFNRMDLLRIKIRKAVAMRGFEVLLVNDGTKDFFCQWYQQSHTGT